MAGALCLLATGASSASALAPTIVKASYSAVREHSIVLQGEVNPGLKFTQYHFEYGLTDCSSSTCASLPTGSIPSGALPVPVKTEVTGLSEGTTYHFRLVASNNDGAKASPDDTFTTFTTPPPFGSCANDGLRLNNPMAELIEYSSANLPDCRAYEQASPVDKNGSNATGTVAWVKASSNGDDVSFLTTSGLDEAESLPTELPTWLATKANDKWSTQGLFAPAGSGQAIKILGWLPDHSVTFEYARKEGPPKEAALLARDSSNHSLTEIVPYHTFTSEPTYAYIGASADGQAVLFESNEKLTDEATAGKPNVYAWDPGSNTLRLASRLPEDECATAPCAPAAGAFGGAYAWMNQSPPAQEGQDVTKEGGATAGNYNQDLHAVSANGRYAYFTAAASGQLYVRVNPTEAQSPLEPSGKCEDPDLACTLRVSASKKTNGLGPDGTDAAGPRPAAFMAASADGKVAYFTSAEKLTNNANTGPEPDASPSIARSDLAGTPASVDLSFLPQRAAGMATDGTHLYWADPVKGSIGRAKLNGTDPATEVEEEFITSAELEAEAEVEVETEPGVFEPQVQSFANPRYVAVDGTHVYWTNATNGEDGKGTIGRAKLGTTGPEDPEPEFITGASNPTGIDVDETSTFLYWGNAGQSNSTRTIGRAKIGSSEAEEVNRVFIPIDFGPGVAEGIAVNATHIYAGVNENDNSYVFRYDLDGDQDSWKVFGDFPHPNLPGVRGIALDATHVYWTRPWGESIGRINLALEGSSFEQEFIKDAGVPLGLALDAGHFYWSANQEINPNPGNDLYRFEAEAGTLEDLTPDPDGNGAEVKGVLGASADGSHVYFAANAALAAGATPGNCKGSVASGNLGFSGQCSLYLYRKGQPLSFVARLEAGGSSLSDAANWLPIAPATRVQKTSRVSPDGETLIFRSQQQLGSYDNEGVPELYRFRVGEGIECISCSPVGAPPSGPAGLGNIAPPFLLPIRTAAVLSRNLSADGDRAFFETTDALVAGDTNGDEGCPLKGTERFTFPTCQDVYEWEAPGTGSCASGTPGGCLYLLSTGKATEASFFGDASVEGNHAFIFTYAKLVGQDQDQLYDLYDAGVDGGLKSQNEPPPPACTSPDGCQGQVGPAPPFQSPGSESFSGSGNVKAKPGACPKGKKKVRSKGKTRCVAKHKGKKGKGKQQKRAAKKTGRAAR